MTERIISLKQVIEKVGFCKSTIRSLELENKFPKRVRTSYRKIGWLESDIEKWIQSLKQKSSGE